MRNFTIVILNIFWIIGCSTGSLESFQAIDPTAFNEEIRHRTDIGSAEALMTLFYNYPSEEEGGSNILIESSETGNLTHEITLIHDRLMDDSQRGIKIVMTAKRSGESWEVIDLKKNWKCWEGRGHTDWGVAYCQ